MGRSGSSWIGDLLNSHPDITYHYEVLLKPKENPVTFIQNCLQTCDSKIHIAKVLYHQLERSEWKELYQNPFFHTILIKRNPLDRFISLKLAEKTGLWHLDQMLNEDVVINGLIDIIKGRYSFSEVFARLKGAVESYYQKWTYRPEILTLSANEFAQQLEYQYQQEIFFNQISNHRLLEIDYETVLSWDYPQMCQSLCDLLDISRHELTSSRQKIDFLPSDQRVKNFQELEKTYHRFCQTKADHL